ncbi:MAG: tyrosine-type recombinase/integrase [Phycisphaerales bacterium]|nr:MAG: tyrosine-type recombinase/integrase [Phycisphaerales bacterium]
MAHKKVSITRKWYGKIPIGRNGKPIPRNLWPKRRKYSWEVRWYSSDGKRYSKSFKDRKEAEKHANTVQEKVDRGKCDKPRKITLAEFIVEHSQVMVGQKAHTTVKDHLRALTFFAKHVSSGIMLERVSPRHAESFVARRLADGLAVGTVNKDIRTLRGIFNLAIEPRGYLEEGTNPFAKIKERRIAAVPPNYVPAENFKKVLNACKNTWWRAFLTLAYTSAGRRDELLNLTWPDIDFESQNVGFFPKKASATILAWHPKDHESRVVPIPAEAIQLLANLQTESEEGNPYVFIPRGRWQHILGRRSEGTWQPDYEIINNLTRSIETLCRRSCVDYFTPHDLRRSCITNWSKKLSIQTVQHLAGHSNIGTPRKYYLSVQSSDMEAAREIQSELMTSLTNY